MELDRPILTKWMLRAAAWGRFWTPCPHCACCFSVATAWDTCKRGTLLSVLFPSDTPFPIGSMSHLLVCLPFCLHSGFKHKTVFPVIWGNPRAQTIKTRWLWPETFLPETRFPLLIPSPAAALRFSACPFFPLLSRMPTRNSFFSCDPAKWGIFYHRASCFMVN